MGDPKRGLYEKFQVKRMDGSDGPGKKHDGCRYFVLDLDHDQHARAGILAYAESCWGEYPLLADDLRQVAGSLQDRAQRFAAGDDQRGGT